MAAWFPLQKRFPGFFLGFSSLERHGRRARAPAHNLARMTLSSVQREAELAGRLNYGAALVATCVHRAFFDETQGISPGILGIERSLTPGAHDDPASGCIVNVLARQTVQRLRTFECWF
jgi:hypothetical protein